ncbi:hypothetical protein BJ741DRAFT_119635 [Chytriomyces cf. hyalinus JEL632]|nr:hypothetical protein BJ741DRAFT_119635 [Chytriomyces cf. hyalinus JEL632]
MVRKAEFLLVCCVSVAVLSLCFLSATTVPHRYTRINEPYQLPECMTSGGYQRDCFNSHDRISAVHFKLLADHYIGNYSVPATYADQLRRIRMSEPLQLDNQITKDGAVIFVEPLKLKEFVSVASRIRTRFILITGDGDECLPDCVLSQDETLSLTENPKLIKWYVTNCVGYRTSSNASPSV